MFPPEHQDSINQCCLTDEEPAEPKFFKKREKRANQKFFGRWNTGVFIL